MFYKVILFIVLIFGQSIYAKDLKIVYTGEMRNILDEKNGAYGNLLTLLQKYRKNNDVLFLFGGNSFGPSLISNIDKGKHIVKILNILKPDVLGVNHSDFMFSTKELSLRSKEADFPFVSTNILDKNNQRIDGILSKILVKKADLKIGIISIVGEEIKNRFFMGDIKVKDIQESIKINSNILRQQGADIVVVLTTAFLKIPHTFIKDGIVDLVLSKYINLEVKQDVKNVFNLSKVGEVFVFSVQKKNNKYTFDVKEEFLLDYKNDEKIHSIIKNYDKKINSYLGKKIATTKVKLNTKREVIRGQENIFANLLADSIKNFTKSDIALINGGSIRGNTTYETNSVLTRKHIISELPFRNKLVLTSLYGEDILKILEYSFLDNNISGKFLHISGGKIIYNSSEKSKHKVKKVFIGDEPLQKDKLYTVSTIDFLYNGGDGYTMFKNGVRIRNNKLDYSLSSDVLIDYILEKKTIDMRLEGRIEDIAKQGKK